MNIKTKCWWDSGWRPFIGWVCGFSLALFFIPQYICAVILWVIIFFKTGKIEPYPVSPAALIELIVGLLGLSALRTVEKIKNVAQK